MDFQTTKRQTEMPEPPGPCTAKEHQVCPSDAARQQATLPGERAQCSQLTGRWPMSPGCCCFTVLLFSTNNITSDEYEEFINASSSGDKPGTKRDMITAKVNAQIVLFSIENYL